MEAYGPVNSNGIYRVNAYTACTPQATVGPDAYARAFFPDVAAAVIGGEDGASAGRWAQRNVGKPKATTRVRGLTLEMESINDARYLRIFAPGS